MPRNDGPLTPAQARLTLAHRIAGRVADRLRPLATKFGIRPYRTFLVWVRWSGAERGEGQPVVVKELEILPTPLVESLDALTLAPNTAGTLEVGSVRVSQISAVKFSEDMLAGIYPGITGPAAKPVGLAVRMLPSGVVETARLKPGAAELPEPFEFFYEVAEDGRGDDPPTRKRFRPMSDPFRRAGKLDWTIMLERVSEDRGRNEELEPELAEVVE